MTSDGESGKRAKYRSLVFEQIRFADELHISFEDSSKMSVLDRKYANEYLDMKMEQMTKSIKK